MKGQGPVQSGMEQQGLTTVDRAFNKVLLRVFGGVWTATERLGLVRCDPPWRGVARAVYSGMVSLREIISVATPCGWIRPGADRLGRARRALVGKAPVGRGVAGTACSR
jgi:hypothetical protein